MRVLSCTPITAPQGGLQEPARGTQPFFRLAVVSLFALIGLTGPLKQQRSTKKFLQCFLLAQALQLCDVELSPEQ